MVSRTRQQCGVTHISRLNSLKKLTLNFQQKKLRTGDFIFMTMSTRKMSSILIQFDFCVNPCV